MVLLLGLTNAKGRAGGPSCSALTRPPLDVVITEVTRGRWTTGYQPFHTMSVFIGHHWNTWSHSRQHASVPQLGLQFNSAYSKNTPET
jgi:hypothetical protein